MRSNSEEKLCSFHQSQISFAFWLEIIPNGPRSFLYLINFSVNSSLFSCKGKLCFANFMSKFANILVVI